MLQSLDVLARDSNEESITVIQLDLAFISEHIMDIYEYYCGLRVHAISVNPNSELTVKLNTDCSIEVFTLLMVS